MLQFKLFELVLQGHQGGFIAQGKLGEFSVTADYILGAVEGFEVCLSQIELTSKQGDRLLVDVAHQGVALALQLLYQGIVVLQTGTQLSQAALNSCELVECG